MLAGLEAARHRVGIRVWRLIFRTCVWVLLKDRDTLGDGGEKNVVGRAGCVHVTSMDERLFTFAAGTSGAWKIDRMLSVAGPSLPRATHMQIFPGDRGGDVSGSWSLRGRASEESFLGLIGSRAPFDEMAVHPEQSHAALVATRKSAEWWALAQGERERLLEEQGAYVRAHVAGLSKVSVQLCDCRRVSPDEPFDSLAWFEYDAKHTLTMNELVESLRHSRERDFVVWEVELRLSRMRARKR